ncbi:MAG: polysaccharide deacetylase family protein [Nitrospinota bacterium]|jgi:peptidoglycan/xylan/chitin deacetylase (PgdA/CDA1 family)
MPAYKFTPFLLTLGIILSAGCMGILPSPEKKPFHLTQVEKKKIPEPEFTGKDRERISEDYIVVIASPSDTYESLAEKYYGDKSISYIISEFNHNTKITPDREIIIPHKSINPGGIHSEGYQMVPILCYHQFSKKKVNDKMIVTEETFDRQMAYLKLNGYNVITLKELSDFINYKTRPPKNSVVITIDDGWKSARTIAVPILKKYGFRATLFIYTDLIKPGKITLSWDDIKEILHEGVIDVQSHTTSHPDLTKIKEGESEIRYIQRLENEIGGSQKIIEKKLGVKPLYLAYPFGTFNDTVIKVLIKYQYKGAFTVIKGGNPFFYNHFSLNRSMVFNSNKIEDFIKLLDTFKKE